jgi:DNA-binding Lrp family transcriptional regulator
VDVASNHQRDELRAVWNLKLDRTNNYMVAQVDDKMVRNDALVDELDISILKLLRDDARLSFRNIGKALNMSTGTISQRIKRLINTGVIRKFTTVIDPEKVGKHCTILVMVRSRPGAHLEDIVKKIEALDESCCIHTITGDFNLHVLLRLKDHHAAADFLENLRNLKGVQFITSYVVLRSYKHFYDSSI